MTNNLWMCKLKFQKELTVNWRCFGTMPDDFQKRSRNAKMRSRARQEASAQKVPKHHKQFVKQNSKSTNIVLTTRFSILSISEKRCNCKMGTHYQRQTRAAISRKNKMGTERFPRKTEGISTNRIPCEIGTQRVPWHGTNDILI